jgi:AcrR family transcriptional regulator
MTYVMTDVDRSQPPPRERMIRSAARLIQERGLSGAGMRDIAEHAEAPRGSLQHYFPGGKEQVVAEALDWVASVLVAQLADGAAGSTPREVVATMFDRWERVLAKTDYLVGCPVVATVTDAVADEELRTKAAEVFRIWRRSLSAALLRSGVSEERAEPLAVLAMSALEGAIVMSRARRDLEPLRTTGRELDVLFAALPPAA